jgi:hypothetical protein
VEQAQKYHEHRASFIVRGGDVEFTLDKGKVVARLIESPSQDHFRRRR